MSAAGERPWRGRRLHLVGVGGAGMSAYARAAHALGASVSGSDGADGPYLQRLRRDGVLQEASVGHAAANVPAGEDVEVFYSSAIPAANVERESAVARGLRVSPRAELLGELSSLRRTIAVAGTHGKTTTSAMIAQILRSAGLDPSWLVGAPIGGGLANAQWGEGQWLVVEADESDRSMLSLHVETAVLLNVELDHHASFPTLEELREAFRELLTGPTHAIVWDRPELLALRDGERVAFDVAEVDLSDGGSRFRWRGEEVSLAVPGEHNALDATAALEAARLAGVPAHSAVAALASFTGAGRRFQRVGRSRSGAEVYEDYAHHPTEIAATLSGARTLGAKRVIAVFQPHLFSRTQLLAEEFGRALADAEEIVVLDVYPARERAEDFPGVSGRTLLESVARHAPQAQASYAPSFAQAREALEQTLREGDLCVVMGAGDVDELARMLLAGGER